MKKAIKRNWIIFVVILLTAAGIIYVYDPIAGDSGWPSGLSRHFKNAGLYRINPGTILTSWEKGDTNVFLLDPRSLDDRNNGPIVYNEPVGWSQSENLKISRALNNFIWNDDLDDWNLFSMAFNVNCQDNLDGLQGGLFKYFRTTFEHGRIAYTWREIEINPLYSYVAWGADAKFAHPLFGWKSIEISRLKITAEEAIRIAENNGGKEARSKVQNQCDIYLLLMPERYTGWWINYGYSSGFEIQIDPYTGKVIK